MSEYKREWIKAAEDARRYIDQTSNEDLAAKHLADQIKIAELEEENRRLQHEQEINGSKKCFSENI